MKRKILITSISSDSHTWNLVYMQLLCEELGCDVVNIGNCIPHDYLIQKLHYCKPDILLISSVNGHGYIEGIEIIRKIKNYRMLRQIISVIGGKLDTQRCINSAHIQKLYDEGFNGVFVEENSIDRFISFLNFQTDKKYKTAG